MGRFHLTKILQLAGVVISAGPFSSCAYRFTNIALKPPQDTRTICVESVYDTSNEVIPNEFLWHAIQNEIVKNGHLVLDNCERADAYMQVSLNSASIQPTGTPQTVDRMKRDPAFGDRESLSPDDYHNLRTAGTYTSNELVNFSVNVKVFHLKKQKLLFEQNYQRSGQFRSVTDSKLAQKASGFLLYQESLEARFQALTQSLAKRITSDFLLSYRG